MTPVDPVPELAIIVPVLNEAGAVGSFVERLAEQRDVDFELVFADGGSSDGTCGIIRELGARFSFPITLRSSPPGRGRQLNAAARCTTASWLLFLHVDSRLVDPCALRRGLDLLAEALDRQGGHAMAGHFALRFCDQGEGSPFGFYFYETKARLDRPECIHGDQGFLLPRRFFLEVGPFDETLSILEDNRLAERIRLQGRWLLLPAEIETSARRFLVEGLAERQVLNALIMNFAAIGWQDFFREASTIYRTQDQAGRLDLLPYLELIRHLLGGLPWQRKLELWQQTGRYVRSHGWQLALAWDARRSYQRKIPPGEGPMPTLAFFDRWYDRLTDNPVGRFAATLLVWGWFQALRLVLRLRSGRPWSAPGIFF